MNSELQTRWTTALQRLFRRQAPEAAPAAAVPAGTAVYAIGA